MQETIGNECVCLSFSYTHKHTYTTRYSRRPEEEKLSLPGNTVASPGKQNRGGDIRARPSDLEG